MKTNINQLHALHYHSLGMNVGCICNIVTEINFYEKNILKTPCHYWKDFSSRKQLESEINALPWEDSTGVAIIAGYNNFHALDIDGCSNTSFVEDILTILGLESDYEWVVRTGSLNGFHIYFYSEVLDNHSADDAVSTFPPNLENEQLFEKIELLWNVPIVAPPSVHISTHNYTFINCRIPKHAPKFIEINRFKVIESLFLNRRKIVKTNYTINRSTDLNLKQPSDIEEANLKELKGSLFFVFDTETDGSINKSDPLNNKYPKILHISWLIMDFEGIVHKKETRLISCDFDEESDAFKINKLNKNVIKKLGMPPIEVYRDVINDLKYCEYIVAYDLGFNLRIVKYEISNNNLEFDFSKIKKVCIMKNGARVFQFKIFKYPNLAELYELIFNYKIQQIHSAEADALIVLKCCRELLKREDLKFYI